MLVVTELPEETKPIPAEEPSPFESPLFLASLGVGGAGLLLAAAGVGSVVYEATAFQAELGAEHVELGGQVDGRDVYVIKQGAEHVDGYDEAMEENYSIAEGLWYGGWVAFGIGLATLATGAALLAWDLTDTPAPTEATPAGAEATATPQ